MSWKNQIEEANVEYLFGSNVKWHIDKVKLYIEELEKLGAGDITIADQDTLRFTLPEGAAKSNVLLHVLTQGKMPTSVVFDAIKGTLQLNWDW